MPDIHARQALTPEGWVSNLRVSHEGGRITALAQGPAAGVPSVDLLLPAPANLHSHAFQRAMSGLTEARGPDPSDSFWTWRRLMYRYLDRMTPDQIEAITALVFMEMLEAGYGAVAEFHYLHHAPGGTAYDNLAETASRIVSAAKATGIGLTLLPVLYMQGGCDGRALEGGQRRFGCDADLYARLYQDSAALIAGGPSDATIGVAPHSLRAVPAQMLDQLRAIAPSGPIHMHLAEQQAEVDEVIAHLGARPVEWLLQNADPGPDWCLIHCTQMTGAETKGLAATGAVAGLCPITESSLGDGIFNGTTYSKAEGRFGVGSDSNIHIALWQELATLEYSQRLRDRSRAALATVDRSTGRALFDAVVAGGAQAAGRTASGIAVGQLADLIAVNTDNEVLCNRTGDAVLDSLIFGGCGQSCVTDVWSAGRHVVSEGRHIRRSEIVHRFLGVVDELGQMI